MNLSDAITAAEKGEAVYQTAVNTTTADQGLADTAQKKADDAKATVAGDQQSQDAAKQALVGNLQDLVAAALAEIAGLNPPIAATP